MTIIGGGGGENTVAFGSLGRLRDRELIKPNGFKPPSRCRPQKFLPYEAVKILVEVGRIELPSDTNRRDFLQVESVV